MSKNESDDKNAGPSAIPVRATGPSPVARAMEQENSYLAIEKNSTKLPCFLEDAPSACVA